MAKVSYKLLEKRTADFLAANKAVRSMKDRVFALSFQGQFPDRSSIVQPGFYKALRRSEAAWNFLMLSGVPQTTTQIAVALQRGVIRTIAKDDYKATYSCLYAGSERGKFRRFGTKHWTIAI